MTRPLHSSLRPFPVLCALVALLSLAGCSGGGDPASPPGDDDPPPDVQQVILEAHETIDAAAGAALLSDTPMAGLAALQPTVTDDPAVAESWLTDNALWVRYDGGGLACWYVAPPEVEPPEPVPAASARAAGGPSRQLVGNRQACVINQQYYDELRPHSREVANTLTSLLTLHGYDVTSVDGTSANLPFLGGSLDDYGLVFYLGHGVYDGGHTWLGTGEEHGATYVITHHWDDWINERISWGTQSEMRDGDRLKVSMVIVSELFFADRYAAGALPGSLIYLAACQSFKGTTQLAETLRVRGAAATVGWDETNCVGQTAGLALIMHMLDGSDLATAYAALPAPYRHDESCEGYPPADLAFHPASGGSVQLLEPELATTTLVDNDFESYPVGSPPPQTGGNDPTRLILQPDSSALIRNGWLGIPSNSLVLQGTYPSYANVRWSFPAATEGVLRVECVISLQQPANLLLAHTSDENGASASTVSCRDSGTIWAGHLTGAQQAGQYAAGVPFAVRMDFDLAAETFVVSVDNELDGFADDPATAPVPRINGHIPFLGIAHTYAGLVFAGGTTSATVAYDYMRVQVLD